MSTVFQAVLLVLMFGCHPVAMTEAFAQTAARPTKVSLTQLAFMAGHWQSTAYEKIAEEHWMQPRGGLMLGMGRIVVGTEVVQAEALSIEETTEAVIYRALPSGQSPTEFRLTQAEGQLATFENPQHDFPQRIVYERSGNTLQATISSLDGKKSTSFSWDLRE